MEGKAGISCSPGNGVFVSSVGLEDFTHFDLSFHLIFVVHVGVCFCQSSASRRFGEFVALLWGRGERWWLQQETGHRRAGAAPGAVAVPGLWFPAGVRNPGSCSGSVSCYR